MTDSKPQDDKPLFGRPWIFIRGVPSMKFLPPEGPMEICLLYTSDAADDSLLPTTPYV